MKYLLLLLPFLITIQLSAQPGSLDPSFGISGVAQGTFTTDYNSGYGVYQQSDGKILNVGTVSQSTSTEDFYLLRYLSDGTRDSSFGVNGAVIDSIGSADDQALDVIQQTDSKILVVGSFDNPLERDVFIRRYDSTGVLDTSFATAGMVTTDFQNGSDDGGFRVLLQPDGKIIVGGPTTDTINYATAVMLLRYNADGSLDTSFGSGGKVLFSQPGAGDQYLTQCALQADGKILIVGVSNDANGYEDILAVRFLSDGSRDSSFNGDGIFTFDLTGDDDEGWAIALQQDGKILVGGLGITINGEDDLLIRLDTAGYPDTTFNSTGIITKDHNQGNDYVTSILVQQNGKIITVGQSYGLDEEISLTRYLNTGADDVSFGTGGSILNSMGNGDSNSNSAILQTDNRIVITGWIETPNTSNNYVARFENDSLTLNVSEMNVINQSLYPSPANDKIYIKDFKAGSIANVMDAQGKIVYSDRIENNSLDVSHLTPGIYLLRLESGKEQFVQKFIKQ